MDAQQLGGLGEIALRDQQRRLDVTALPLPQREIEIEVLLHLQMAARGFEQRLEVLSCRQPRQLEVHAFHVKLRLQLLCADHLTGVFRGEADHDIP
ncbi:hypothetical protein D3C83_63150 [compost metagenome]